MRLSIVSLVCLFLSCVVVLLCTCLLYCVVLYCVILCLVVHLLIEVSLAPGLREIIHSRLQTAGLLADSTFRGSNESEVVVRTFSSTRQDMVIGAAAGNSQVAVAAREGGSSKGHSWRADVGVGKLLEGAEALLLRLQGNTA